MLLQIGKRVAGERLLHFRTNPIQNGNVDGLDQQLSKEISSIDGQTEDKNKCVPLLNEGKIVNSRSSLGVPHEKVNMEDQCDPTSFSYDHGILNESELNAKALEDKVVGKSEGKYLSVLDKFFGSALTMNDDSTVDSAEVVIPLITFLLNTLLFCLNPITLACCLQSLVFLKLTCTCP